MTYNRIMIFGRPGSGKSTFALKLKHKLKLPLYHLDKYFYQSNWVERSYQEFIQIQKNLINQDKWIIDGNSTRSLEMRYAKANLVIYFNLSRLKCYYQIFKRLFVKDKQIDDRAENCPETVRLSLLKYMWTFEERVSSTIKYLKMKYPNTKFIEVRNYFDIDNFYKKL